jgi:excisionase family DNA binding protein
MSYESIEEGAYKNVMATLGKVIAKLQQIEERQLLIDTKQDATKVVYNNRQVCDLLGVHKNTLQMYRDEQKINFSRCGRKIFYTLADVEGFLEQSPRPLPEVKKPIPHPMVRT